MIQTRDLVKRFGMLEVLRGVSWQVRRGEVAVIVGASGSGKSTFLRCLNGLEPFDAGEVRIGERSLKPGPSDRQAESQLRLVRRQVGMVFQQFNLFPHLSVMGNVIEAPVRVLKLPREQAIDRARALLERVGLAEKFQAMPEELSGGQQQRVAIARALAMEPQAILFDEPTSALDPRMTAEVLAVLSDLASSGQTMVVVTHAMDFARRAADTVHVFHEGQVVESGPAKQIFESARHPAAAAFVSDISQL